MRVAGAHQSYGANATVGFMQIFAEEIDDLETDVAMLVEEVQQVFPPDLGNLDLIDDLGGDLVQAAGKSSAQAENLTGSRGAQGHAATAFRADRKANASLTEQENATRGLAFAKQDGSARVSL